MRRPRKARPARAPALPAPSPEPAPTRRARWATQIETPDGELKAKYNIGQAVLAPLPQVHATRETLMRKDAFMASPKT